MYNVHCNVPSGYVKMSDIGLSDFLKYSLSQVKRRMLEQRHEEESVRMESDILKIKVYKKKAHTNCIQEFKLVREAIIRKKFYFTKKFHKTVTPPSRRGFMKLYFFSRQIRLNNQILPY